MKPLIIANWKANKTLNEAAEWAEKTLEKLSSFKNTQVVVCGSFVTLTTLKENFSSADIKIGAQNVSHLGPGAFTGEVTAEMLEGIVDYCIVGHSERKKHFAETEEVIARKVELLLGKNITPVLCVADLQQMDNYLSQSETIKTQAEKIIFVYEPPGAISGGGDYKPETPESAEENARLIKEKVGSDATTIYGGSVNPDNIKSFLAQQNIAGALPGQASLDPDTFLNLISAANEAVV